MRNGNSSTSRVIGVAGLPLVFMFAFMLVSGCARNKPLQHAGTNNPVKAVPQKATDASPPPGEAVATPTPLKELVPTGTSKQEAEDTESSDHAATAESPAARRKDVSAEQREPAQEERARGEPIKVIGPKGGHVFAADERTKEFLQKAFKIGFLFPDSRIPGAIDFDLSACMWGEGRELFLKHFPSGKLELQNVSKEKGKIVYSLPQQ